MQNRTRATVEIAIDLVNGAWRFVDDGDELLSGPSHPHVDDDQFPTVYELTAALMESLPPRYTTRLVYLDIADSHHPAWTLQQAEGWAKQHVDEAGFPLATVLENGNEISRFRNDEYDFDSFGEPV